MVKRTLLILAAVALSVAGVAFADDAQTLDWSDWRHMPVFSDGRVMPLDTFARETVTAICGSPDPTLIPPQSSSEKEETDAKPRRFTSAELIFSWLVEPERWERAPLLAAADQPLRKALGLPLADNDGRRLRFASPHEIENNGEIGRLLDAIQTRAKDDGAAFRLTGADKKLEALVGEYHAYRQLTFDPAATDVLRSRFSNRAGSAISAWEKLAGGLVQSEQLSNDDDIRRWMVQAGEAIQQLIAEMHGGGFSLEKTETVVGTFRDAAEQLADRLAGIENKPLAALASELRRQTIEAHGALFDNGGTLRLVPALAPAALEENRVPEDDAQPWLSAQAMLFGSDAVLRGYPTQELQFVRAAFANVKAAYLDRDAADRATRFSAAMRHFATAVRTLGESMEPVRQKLPIRHRDQAILDATAYPPAGSTDVEVFYNRVDPFFWSWTISLAAAVCLAVSRGRLRKPMFWLGAVALLVAQAFTLLGFGIRAYVTGLVPLTGMFETVVFVALGVALLGVGFAIAPLIQPGLREAWQLTGFRGSGRSGTGPFFGEPIRHPDKPPTENMDLSPSLVRRFLFVFRLVLMALLLLVLVRWPDGSGWGCFELLPQKALGATSPSANDVLVWLASVCVVAITIYFVPRGVLAWYVAHVTVPIRWFREETAAAMNEVMKRRMFVLGAAVLSGLTVVLACHAPATVMKRNLGAVAPNLRDNYWLAVHVVTIMASYATAAIALVLANIALGYYLLGSYRDGPTGRHPPEACATLAGFTYTAVKITVLLLAAGTILGALWGDKAWGHFWAWDPKEVWALISLLVYLLILHARHVGWAGEFGMAVAAVLGAVAVLWTWYGVNFVLGSGMHAYGSGSGGQWYVAAVVALEWLFLFGAAMRYLIECGGAPAKEGDLT